MKNMMETVGQLNVNPFNQTESEALRLTIREEVNEVEERQKRKSMLVVKSLEVLSGRELVEVFYDVWKYILGTEKVLQLSDIVSISRDMKPHRAQIENFDIRRF